MLPLSRLGTRPGRLPDAPSEWRGHQWSLLLLWPARTSCCKFHCSSGQHEGLLTRVTEELPYSRDAGRNERCWWSSWWIRGLSWRIWGSSPGDLLQMWRSKPLRPRLPGSGNEVLRVRKTRKFKFLLFLHYLVLTVVRDTSPVTARHQTGAL
jgi:hypothetical protein